MWHSGRYGAEAVFILGISSGFSRPGSCRGDVVGKIRSGKERQELSRGDQAEMVKTRVVSWQPETATLVYQDEQEPERTVVIQPLKPVVIVPVSGAC